jgi:cytosine/adenosine deaminase-related metal-dependent hydrolase
VVLDYFSPTELKQENFLGHFIFGLNASCVESVINCGRLVVKERKVLGWTRKRSPAKRRSSPAALEGDGR